MIGLMDKGGANSTQPQQGGLASVFMNNTATPAQSIPQITMPAINFGAPSAPAGLTPQQAAALTAARIQARIPPAPVAAAPTGPVPFTGDANLPKVKPQGIVGRNFASAR